MTTHDEVEEACRELQFFKPGGTKYVALIRRLRDERDEARGTVILRECEIDTLEDEIVKARNKALDEAAAIVKAGLSEIDGKYFSERILALKSQEPKP